MKRDSWLLVAVIAIILFLGSVIAVRTCSRPKAPPPFHVENGVLVPDAQPAD